MATDLAVRERPEADAQLIEQVVIQGDLSKLEPAQRASYYARVCESLGINPYTRPFEYLAVQGKLILYARKDATDQLRRLHRVQMAVVSRERIDDLYVVTARATLPDGRQDEEIGAVPIGGLKGEALANALMKASTKAKRRVTLSIVGLGWLDESEVDSIADARPVAVDDAGIVLAAPAEASADLLAEARALFREAKAAGLAPLAPADKTESMVRSWIEARRDELAEHRETLAGAAPVEVVAAAAPAARIDYDGEKVVARGQRRSLGVMVPVRISDAARTAVGSALLRWTDATDATPPGVPGLGGSEADWSAWVDRIDAALAERSGA